MSADGENVILVGAKVPLKVQETNLDSTKVIRATLYDLADFTILPGGGSITLTHKANGAYFDDSFTFPTAVVKIFAQYLVFDAGGVTPNTTGEQAVHDIFAAEELSVNLEADLIATVQASEVIEGFVSGDGDPIEATVGDEIEINATVMDDVSVKATVEDETQLTVEVDQ